MQIKILRGCGASGKALAVGKTYSAPEDVSEADAKILVAMEKATQVTETKIKEDTKAKVK